MKFTANRHNLLGIAALGLLAGFWQTVDAAPVLPDLIAWADSSHNYIFGGTVNASLVPGETVYQFTGLPGRYRTGAQGDWRSVR
jgi:hypothetical protein